MAVRKYEDVVRPNRVQQETAMRAQMAKLGADDDRHRLDTMFTGWVEEPEAAAYDNPVPAVLGELSGMVKVAMAELGVPSERLATVHVGSALADDVSAQIQSFDDGSGLVLVSDAVLSLANVYCVYAGQAMSRLGEGWPVKRLFHVFRAVAGGGMGEDPFFLTGLLRYYNVNQRVYGLAAKLGRSDDRADNDVVALITVQATLFVLGHEIAHHALGHTSAVSAFSPGEHLPACSGDARRELDADLLAYRAAVRVFETQAADQPELASGLGTQAATVNAAMGALVAILVLHVTERALFVRRGNTHPPAADRAARLLGGIDGKVQQFVQLFLTKMLAATEAASDFSVAATPFDWARFYADLRVETPQPRSYLDQIALFDRLQTTSRSELLAGLDQDHVDPSRVLLRGSRAALDGDVRGALEIWGVAEELREFICDERQPLTFHTVLKVIREAFEEQDLPKGSALPGSIVAATLVADRLG